MDTLLEALDIKKLPNGVSENDLLKKIYNDNFFRKLALELMVESFDLAVAKKMHPLERADLLKRIGAVAPPPTKVTWIVGQGAVGGQWFIQASTFSQSLRFTGEPERALTLKMLGETCPRYVAEEYAQVFKPVGFAQDHAMHGHFTK
jgi:hypothetical protein